MSQPLSPELEQAMRQAGQVELLKSLHDSHDDIVRKLALQLETIDWPQLTSLIQKSRGSHDAENSVAARAQAARPPAKIVRLPDDPSADPAWQQATRIGQAELRAGRIGVILVAGGQGSRLGFGYPKGMFPIGPVSGHSLYQILAEQVLARSRQAGTRIPLYIMTSEATHRPTVEFFEQHNHFGLPAADVFFFQQGTMPAVDAKSGQVLLAEPDQIALSPDGHGGLLQALARAELFADMRQRGVDTLYYHQVDNPTAIVCDPAFLGFHREASAEISVKVVAKRTAAERMGIVVDVDGVTQIIEYSDLPDDVAARTTDQGELELWCGSTAIHVFERNFLERLVADADSLPFHLAHKKVTHITPEGTQRQPDEPNAIKFEKFIFDALPQAKRVLVMEADRAREFNPVKNADGDDSPATAQAALANLASQWLQATGETVADGEVCEISPLLALSAEELKQTFAEKSSVVSRFFSQHD